MDILDHLKQRHLDISRYNIYISNDCVVFPLWTFTGRMIGYQQYRPDGEKKRQKDPRMGRYFTKTSFDKTPALWGVETINTDDKLLFVTEGIFKACRLHNLGYNAIAVLGNDPARLKEWLYSCGYKTVAVCDGDRAGRKLARYCHHDIYLPDGVYIDEMSELEIERLGRELALHRIAGIAGIAGGEK